LNLGRIVGQALVSSRIYKPIRFAYQAAFESQAIARRKQRREFYSQIIRPGDLVFDVGANLGNYSEAFCALGAVVVAVEPDPRNLAVLRKRLRREHVYIEPCALGSEEGTAELHFADRNDVSTLAPQWATAATAKWIGTVSVPVRTLDSLASKYGSPRYVKVDAEGFDCIVLRGMSFDPPMVSFEFLPDNLTVARDCISVLDQRLFNFVVEEQSTFGLSDWVTASNILTVLSGLRGDVRYGDVFAKTPK
jgi:FkbM family methyltransferase